jgi:hypothetical protein
VLGRIVACAVAALTGCAAVSGPCVLDYGRNTVRCEPEGRALVMLPKATEVKAEKQKAP